MSEDTSDPLVELRRTYDRDTLDETRAAAEPFAQFRAWIADALSAKLLDANAMTLATVDAQGRPAARVVLLRGWDERGFTFHTNYDSRKGTEIAGNAAGAVVFFWAQLERQVRIDGRLEKLSAGESDAYFATRPRGHRLGAWASPQSAVIASRSALEERLAEAERRFAGVDVPRPPFWGGYRIVPQRFEFWQGRADRVHDRLCYAREATGWTRERLGP